MRIVTHDMMNYIEGPIEFLKNLQPSKSGGEPVMRTSSEKAYKLLSNSLSKASQILRFTRTLMALESGKLKVDLAPHDIGPLVKESSELFFGEKFSRSLLSARRLMNW